MIQENSRKKNNRILGIDPGYGRLGLAVVETSSNGKSNVVYSDCLTTSPKLKMSERLFSAGKEISRVMDEFKPDSIAVENLFITNNQKTAMRVAETRGIIIYEASERNIPIFEYNPMQVKVAVTGDGKSDKKMVIKMVHMLTNIKKEKALDDEYDAIAIALTHGAHYPQANIVAKNKSL